MRLEGGFNISLLDGFEILPDLVLGANVELLVLLLGFSELGMVDRLRTGFESHHSVGAVLVRGRRQLDQEVHVVVDVQLVRLAVAQGHLLVVADVAAELQCGGDPVQHRRPGVVRVNELAVAVDCLLVPEPLALGLLGKLCGVLEGIEAGQLELELDPVRVQVLIAVTPVELAERHEQGFLLVRA